jgi:hypothetical protein
MISFLFPVQKELAQMKYQYSIDELKHREYVIQARLEEEQAKQQELEEHKVPLGKVASPLPGSELFMSAP